jgi:YegS/Rv2252/BmrU family lipid kinase
LNSNQRLLAIVNAAAGGGRSRLRWERTQDDLRHSGIRFEPLFTTEPGHARRVAEQMAGHYDAIVAVGGDGTVGEVADGIIASGTDRCSLAVLPLGTGNDFSTLLGIRDVATGVACLAAPKEGRMDVIQVRCHHHGRPVTRHALVFASVGIAGALLRHTTPRVKRIFGPKACYSVGLLRAIPGFRSPFMRLQWDDAPIEGRFLLACVANAERAGGGMMRLAPGARTDDGTLEVSLIDAMNWLQILKCFPLLLSGAHVNHPKVKFGPARRLTVETDSPMDVQMDGDVFGQTPVAFEVKPLRLKVWVPTCGVRRAVNAVPNTPASPMNP